MDIKRPARRKFAVRVGDAQADAFVSFREGILVHRDVETSQTRIRVNNKVTDDVIGTVVGVAEILLLVPPILPQEPVGGEANLRNLQRDILGHHIGERGRICRAGALVLTRRANGNSTREGRSLSAGGLAQSAAHGTLQDSDLALGIGDGHGVRGSVAELQACRERIGSGKLREREEDGFAGIGEVVVDGLQREDGFARVCGNGENPSGVGRVCGRRHRKGVVAGLCRRAGEGDTQFHFFRERRKLQADGNRRGGTSCHRGLLGEHRLRRGESNAFFVIYDEHGVSVFCAGNAPILRQCVGTGTPLERDDNGLADFAGELVINGLDRKGDLSRADGKREDSGLGIVMVSGDGVVVRCCPSAQPDLYAGFDLNRLVDGNFDGGASACAGDLGDAGLARGEGDFTAFVIVLDGEPPLQRYLYASPIRRLQWCYRTAFVLGHLVVNLVDVGVVGEIIVLQDGESKVAHDKGRIASGCSKHPC